MSHPPDTAERLRAAVRETDPPRPSFSTFRHFARNSASLDDCILLSSTSMFTSSPSSSILKRNNDSSLSKKRHQRPSSDVRRTHRERPLHIFGEVVGPLPAKFIDEGFVFGELRFLFVLLGKDGIVELGNVQAKPFEVVSVDLALPLGHRPLALFQGIIVQAGVVRKMEVG
mmetsp:Transcript_6716/g.16537  ORF Transcript_6716/g.16537 Transcript_6716/m.16537 type:complete len:171 (+) Transcript_6716:1262-1774(+)